MQIGACNSRHIEIATILKSEIAGPGTLTWRRAFSLTCMAYERKEESGA